MSDEPIINLDSSFSSIEEYLAKSSLYYLNKEILNCTKMTPEPHKQMCDWVDNFKGHERKLMMMSRKSYKTTGVSVGLPIKRLLNNPNDRILLTGQERSYSIDILFQIKGQMTTNDKLIKINGRQFRGKSNWKEYSIVVNGRTDFIAKEPSIGTAGIDSVKAGPHYPLIILDDPESDANTSSIDQLAKLIDNYQKMSPMLTQDGKMIVIGTPYSLDGLYLYILTNQAEYRHYKVLIGQARKEPALLPKINVKYDLLPKGKDGTLLMPGRLTEKFLDDEEAKDPVFFASQYLISFISGAAQEFNPEWFRYVKKEQVPKTLTTYATLDPAYSKASSADYTAIIVAGVDLLANIFILKVIHDRMTPDQITDTFYDLYKEYNLYKIGIEANGIQMIFQWVFDKAAATQGFLPIFPLKERSASKEARIRGLIAPYKQGKVYHLTEDGNHAIQEQRILESQLIRFPTAKRNVDAIDAESMLMEIIDVFVSEEDNKKEMVNASRGYEVVDSMTGY